MQQELRKKCRCGCGCEGRCGCGYEGGYGGGVQTFVAPYASPFSRFLGDDIVILFFIIIFLLLFTDFGWDEKYF